MVECATDAERIMDSIMTGRFDDELWSYTDDSSNAALWHSVRVLNDRLLLGATFLSGALQLDGSANMELCMVLGVIDEEDHVADLRKPPDPSSTGCVAWIEKPIASSPTAESVSRVSCRVDVPMRASSCGNLVLCTVGSSCDGLSLTVMLV